MVLSPGTVGSDVAFSGCIGDLTLNGNVINFANSTDKFNEILGKCVLDEHIIEAAPGVHEGKCHMCHVVEIFDNFE